MLPNEKYEREVCMIVEENVQEVIDVEMAEVQVMQPSEKVDVKVLVALPDNEQRLVTYETEPEDTVDTVLKGVALLVNGSREYNLVLYTVIDPALRFDYFVKVTCQSIIDEDEDVIDCNTSQKIYNSEPENIKIVNISSERQFESNSSSLVCNSKESSFTHDFYTNPVYYQHQDGEFEIDVGSEVEITQEWERVEVEVPEENKSENENESGVEVDVETLEVPDQVLPSTESIEVGASDNQSPKIEKTMRSKETIQLEDSPVLERRESKRLQLKSKNEVRILTIYPPPPTKGGISINPEDYKCLAANEFLNDVIIDFYLKYLMQEVLSQTDRDRTHVFSSHFFTRLSNSHPTDGELMTIEGRHSGVHRWTKNVNIFEKDFIIVPVNEHAHWFLAIICFPHLVGNIESDDYFIDNDEVQKPCILIFDSLSGTKKSRVATILRGYLQYEYLAKMKEHKTFACTDLKAIHPRVPKQSNATDCGLYLLQYVENFFKDPIKDFNTPFKDLTDWFTKTRIVSKREEIGKLIGKLAVEYHQGENVALPEIKLPTLVEEAHSLEVDNIDWIASPEGELLFDASPPSLVSKQTTIDDYLSRDPSTSPEIFTPKAKTLPTFAVQKDKHSRTGKDQSAPIQRINKFGMLEIVRSSSTDEETVTLKATRSRRTNVTAKSQYRCHKMVELARSFQKKKEKQQANQARAYHGNSTGLSPSLFNGTNETSTESLFSATESTDKFYNLSLTALKNDSKLSPNISYSSYKIKKKQAENANHFKYLSTTESHRQF